MRPFNLEEYLKDPSQKLITQNGCSVRILCTDKEGNGYPIVALVKDDIGEFYISYNILGNRGPEPDKYSLYFKDLPDNFKPFDRVLTRSSEGLPWKANLFSNFKKVGASTIAVCLNGDYLLNDIIPFDENKVGTLE